MQLGATRVVLVIGHEPRKDRATIGARPKVVFREVRDKLPFRRAVGKHCRAN